MTLLDFLNRFIFQWFFIRLTKHIQTQKVRSLYGNYYALTYYSIQYFVVPLSGYGTNFKYLNKTPKYLQITKKKQL